MEKAIKIKIKPKQHYQAKMTPEELDNYLKMKKSGSSVTKNKKGNYSRKEKHRKNRLEY